MTTPFGRSGYEASPPSSAERDLLGDGDWRRRRVAFTGGAVLLAALLIGLLVSHSTRTPNPVTRVRYINDTSSRLVVTPCGAATRCIVEPGASVVRTPPATGDAWRVIDARTRESAGCIRNTGGRTVRLSDTRFGGTC